MVVSAFNSRTREVEAEAGGEFKTNLVYKLKFQTARTVSGVGWVGWKKPVLTPPRHMAKFCNTKYREEEVLSSGTCPLVGVLGKMKQSKRKMRMGEGR